MALQNPDLPGAGIKPDLVSSVTPHDTDPAWATVELASGETKTMPTADAEALPKVPEPAPVVGVMPQSQEFGAAPVTPPAVQPQSQEFSGGRDDPARDAWLASQQAQGFHGETPGAPFPRDVTRYAPEGAPGTTLQDNPGGESGPAGQVDPNAALATPDEAAEIPRGDVSTTTTDKHTLGDPEAVLNATQDTMGGAADDLQTYERSKQRGAQVQAVSDYYASLSREAEAREQIRTAEVHLQKSKEAMDAIESTPIEEDFFKDAPGRKVSAWLAMALSGFAQGISGGANPVMNTMMAHMQHAYDQFLDGQRKNKTAAYEKRLAVFKNDETTLASYRLQLPKLVEERAANLSKGLGMMQQTPAVTTEVARIRVDSAKAAQEIGMHVDRETAETIKNEKAKGPVFHGDVVLHRLGVEPKAHAEAMDPKGLNLGGVVGGAQDMQDIATALKRLQDSSGNLASQGTLSWSQLGLAPLAARWGIKNAEEQVSTRQLLERAKLAFKQTINIKSVDSENEGKNFNAIMDSGEGRSTVAAIEQKAREANRNAIGIASGVSRNPQGYLQFVEQTLSSNPGVGAGGAAPKPKQTTGYRDQAPSDAGPPPGPAAPDTGGGPAPSSPLAQSPSASAPGSPTAPDSNEEPVNLKTLQGLKSDAEAAGKNGDAITRVVRFEFGNGKPNASGAAGLVQWMPDTFKGMEKPPGYENVTHADLKDLTPEEQVPLAIHYFKGFPELGPTSDVGDYYLAVAAPAALRGHWPDTRVVYKKDPDPKSAWSMNPAWRPADGGDITVGSIKARARRF